MRSNILSTWIVNDTERERSFFPNAGRLSSDDPSVHEMYWRCVVTFYSCAARSNSGEGLRLVLFTNRPVEGRYRVALTDLQVEIVIVPLNHLPPEGYFGRWRNQFYILDILEHLSKQPRGFSCAVLDSDCIVTRPLSELFEQTERNGALLYTIDYRETAMINGLSRSDMKTLFEELEGKPLSHLPEYCGGEFFSATDSAIADLIRVGEAIWHESLRRAAENRIRFNEEAQLLSYLYFHLGFKQVTGNAFVSRLWTQFAYTNVKASDVNLPIWHVPAEKQYGIRRLHGRVQNRNSWFWKETSPDLWRRHIGNLLGIPHASLSKRMIDLGARIREKLF